MLSDAAITLDDLARRHRTDKGHASVKRPGALPGRKPLLGKGYVDTYARFFGHLKDESITLLEIGIDRGASLRMWEDYFTAAKLHALDISRECAKYATDRTRVYIGSQTDPDFLRDVSASTGPLDVVIDDGGHTMEQHRVSLLALWPHIKSGGYYVIEDMHTAYDKSFGGGEPDSTAQQLKEYVDSLNTWGQQGKPIVGDVAGIWFAPSIVVMVKQ